MAHELSDLQREYQEFIESRDWEKYHTPKSTAMSIGIEAGELMEVFQWHDNLTSKKYGEEVTEAAGEELADILLYSMSIAEQLDIDLEAAVLRKMEENQDRFDQERAQEMNQNFGQWKDN